MAAMVVVVFLDAVGAGIDSKALLQPPEDCKVSLIQNNFASSVLSSEHNEAGSVLTRNNAGASPACTPLDNRGTRVTLEIYVGSPSQQFDVVVDTGSNAVIVPSCACVKSGSCSPEDRCYHSKDETAIADGTSLIRMTFGSGSLDALPATDTVQVGSIKARMENSLLLMVRNELSLGGTSFEGILGLGLPHTAADFQEGAGSDKSVTELFNSTGFLESAGIGQFSVCFNQNANGILRLGQGSVSGDMLPSVGKVHWGLGLNGVSVGKSKIDVGLCSPDTKASDQGTACGAIPDSGTTLVMAPKEHILMLFQKICDGWSRCSHPDSDGAEDPVERFLMLLSDCAAWAGDEGEGLKELPPVNFELEGADGKKKHVSLSPSAYIVETLEEDVKHITKHLAGVLPVDITVPTGHETRRCLPAFGVMEYHTESNGPIWIMGMPLFYEYRVGYDLKTSPAAVSFSDQDCGSCQGDQDTSLFSHRRGEYSGARPLNRIKGPVQLPNIDTSVPL
jgi:hypothetical protein